MVDYCEYAAVVQVPVIGTLYTSLRGFVYLWLHNVYLAVTIKIELTLILHCMHLPNFKLEFH